MNIDPFVIVSISLWKLCTVQSVRYLKSTEKVLFFFLNIAVTPKGFSQDCSLLVLHFSDTLYEGTLGPKSFQKIP